MNERPLKITQQMRRTERFMLIAYFFAQSAWKKSTKILTKDSGNIILAEKQDMHVNDCVIRESGTFEKE